MAKTLELDLTSPYATILFDKGKTLNPVFYYLDPEDFSVIDLTGFDARMQARLSYEETDVLNDWDLTIANAGLAIHVGDTKVNGNVITNAQGIKLNVPALVTAAIDWKEAVFDIELIEPSGIVLPFLKGLLIPAEEVTR